MGLMRSSFVPFIDEVIWQFACQTGKEERNQGSSLTLRSKIEARRKRNLQLLMNR